MQWFVYILRCGNGDLYTGLTANVERRFDEHQSGIGGHFTKTSQPVELVYQESFVTEEEARRREVQLKTWSRAKQLALIEGNLQALKRA